ADILALGFFHSGPFGMNVISGVAEDYMAAWDWDDGAPGVTWPAGWSSEPGVFTTGVDFSAYGDENRISDGDLEKILAWHRRWEGEIPEHVEFLAKHYPLALRAYRARYE